MEREIFTLERDLLNVFCTFLDLKHKTDIIKNLIIYTR